VKVLKNQENSKALTIVICKFILENLYNISLDYGFRMKKTLVIGLFLASAMIGAPMLLGVEMVAASEIGDPNERSARDLAPGHVKGFDPQPEPPGRDSSARDHAPGHSEIGDPNAVSPGNLKKLIKPGE
jgi:hypothetical protein